MAQLRAMKKNVSPLATPAPAAILPIEPPLTVEAFAGLIDYHRGSVLRAIRDGRINALQFGQGWRIPAAEARRILATGLPYRAATKGAA
jgi:excisionase family DNA binding protein